MYIGKFKDMSLTGNANIYICCASAEISPKQMAVVYKYLHVVSLDCNI